MNKITLFSASAFCMIVCGTCSTPDQELIDQYKAFADIDDSYNASAGVKCTSVVIEDIVEVKDSSDFIVSTGIVCR